MDGAESSNSAVTGDGCPVELYRVLPTAGEPALIHAAIPRGAEILDLGCGAGRLTHPLIDLGHPVTAVDNSADMLAHVRGATTVLAGIETLDLDRRFPVVLLASNLCNTPDDRLRGRLLATCRRHLAVDGRVLIQWHPPAEPRGAARRPGRRGTALRAPPRPRPLLAHRRIVSRRPGRAGPGRAGPISSRMTPPSGAR